MTKRSTNKPGYWTQKRSELLGPYREALMEGQYVNPDAAALEELRQYSIGLDGEPFQNAENQKEDPTGAKKAHADRVVADAVGWIAALDFGRVAGGTVREALNAMNVTPGSAPLGSYAWRRGGAPGGGAEGAGEVEVVNGTNDRDHGAAPTNWPCRATLSRLPCIPVVGCRQCSHLRISVATDLLCALCESFIATIPPEGRPTHDDVIPKKHLHWSSAYDVRHEFTKVLRCRVKVRPSACSKCNDELRPENFNEHLEDIRDPQRRGEIVVALGTIMRQVTFDNSQPVEAGKEFRFYLLAGRPQAPRSKPSRFVARFTIPESTVKWR